MKVDKKHSVSGLWPALQIMQAEGYDRQRCLRGTDILASQLQDHHQTITFQQEMSFYRNLLEVSDDPTIGLRLGAAYEPQRYGIYSYALFSTSIFRQALVLASRFVELSFSWFDTRLRMDGDAVTFEFLQHHQMDADLLYFFYDRDLAGLHVLFNNILGFPLPLSSIVLPHSGYGQKHIYRDHFSCAVQFDADSPPCLKFVPNLLDQVLPQGDPATAEYLEQQCKILLSKPGDNSEYAHDVRRLILSQPNLNSNIEYVAEKLDICSRTLRRHLKDEGTSYQEIYDDVRFGLAKEYLTGTRITVQDISALLGYNEPASFSNAFRRWAAMSPTDFRISMG